MDLQMVMHRRYPQFIPALNEIHSKYKPNIGKITATFGSVLHSKNNTLFSNCLNEGTYDQMQKLLVSCQEWTSQSDWFMSVDYLQTNQCWTVDYIDSEIKARHMLRETEQPTFLRYNHGNGYHDCLAKISFLETTSQLDANATTFEQVIISLRKNFIMASSCLKDVSFEYEVCQSWRGKTFQEAENNLMTQSPNLSLCCSAIITRHLIDDEIRTVTLSLLLKLQDLVDIPFYSHIIESNKRLTNIPFFEPITI